MPAPPAPLPLPTGVVRRCLSILLIAAATSPGGAAAAGLLQPSALAALVRLLAGRLSGSSSGSEVEAEAAGLLLAISRCGGRAWCGWTWASYGAFAAPFAFLLCEVAITEQRDLEHAHSIACSQPSLAGSPGRRRRWLLRVRDPP